MHKDIQTDRWEYRHAYRQTDGKRHTDRQVERKTSVQIYRRADRHAIKNTDRQVGRQICIQTYRRAV
jgi:hypothetical protein